MKPSDRDFRRLVASWAMALATAMILACSTSGSGSQATGGTSASGGKAGTGGGVSKGGAGGGAGSGGSASGGAASGGIGGSATGGSTVTGLGGSKPLGALSPSESTQLCKDTYDYYGKAVSQATLCKWTGLSYGVSSSAPSDSQLQSTCKSQESVCLNAGATSPSCNSLPANCNATVAQYSSCIVDEADAYNKAVGSIPGCDTVTLTNLQSVWNFLTSDLPASCMAITAICPSLDVPTPRPGTGSSASGGNSGSGGASGGAGGRGSGGAAGGSGGGSGGVAATGGAAGGAGGTPVPGGLPGDVAKTAGTPFVAAHSMTRALFAAYTGPLFKALRVSDKQEKDIGIIASTGLVDATALSAFCSGTSCKVTTLYDQSGNGNDMWRADDPNTNQPGTKRPCDLMDIDYWQTSDGTKMPIAVETGGMWKSTAQCLRNRDKTKNIPTGAKPQTEYAIFHAKYLNNNCCFNYGNTGNAVHYTGPGTLSALNFSKITFWSKGTGDGPWPMVDWEQGVYAGNTAKCGSGAAPTADCTTTGENPNPSVTFDIVTTLFKHNGIDHWALKTANAKAGALSVNIDLSSLPKGYSPLKQEGGLGLGEGGAGDPNGTGGFSEGAVMAGETSNATDDAIQKSIVTAYGK